MAESLIVKLILETSQYTSAADKAARSTDKIETSAKRTQGALGGATAGTGRLAAGIGKVAVAGGALFAGSKLLEFGRDSVQAFSSLEESVNAVEVVFGSASSTIFKFGQTSAESVALSEREFNQLATNTGALLTGFGFTVSEAAAQTITLTRRAADMASVFDKDVGEALQAINAALRGETEQIRVFGVTLSDAQIRMKAVELGLAATTAEVDLNAKAQGALALIMEGTENVAGDFVNTMGSLSNQQKIAAAEAENAQATFGGAFEQLAKAETTIRRQAIPALTELATVTGEVAIGFLGLFGGEELQAAKREVEAFRFVRSELKAGESQLDTYQEALGHLAEENLITTRGVFELSRGLEFQGEEFAVAIARNLEFTRTVEGAGASVEVLEDVLLSEIAALGKTEEETAALIEAYGLQDAAARATAGATGVLGDGMEDGAEKTLSLAEALDVAREASDSLASVLLGFLSPVDKAVQKLGELAEAQVAVAEVQEDGTATAEEIALALLEEALALAETQAALDAIDTQGVNNAVAAFAETLGITDMEARDLLTTLGVLDGTKATVVLETRLTTVGSSPSTPGIGGIGGRQFGGRVSAGDIALVGEAGPEVVQFDRSGTVIPNNRLMPAEGSGGGDITVVINNPTTEHVEDSARRVLARVGFMKVAS